jgi:hypothetical protein
MAKIEIEKNKKYFNFFNDEDLASTISVLDMVVMCEDLEWSEMGYFYFNFTF